MELNHTNSQVQPITIDPR